MDVFDDGLLDARVEVHGLHHQFSAVVEGQERRAPEDDELDAVDEHQQDCPCQADVAHGVDHIHRLP